MRYQSNRPKRRFLAGVACPKCKAMDAVVQVQIFEPNPDEYIECTVCNHTERRPEPTAIIEKNATLDKISLNADITNTTGTSGTVKFID